MDGNGNGAQSVDGGMMKDRAIKKIFGTQKLAVASAKVIWRMPGKP